ncbi:MAG: glutamine--fructose-6-phosphate transaminase (isomerizing) [Alphaproteobacteria bacterium]|nr:MAG: glutamine--fructose-6-phosphate transaminase (isomerizing) [Alphaproteobacteria bacterium]
MCGIIGIVGRSEGVTQRLIEALQRLEYRGYDSAGVAVLSGETMLRRRAEGKLSNLKAVLAADPVDGRIGIGHTRWATHGAATETNAHPILSSSVAMVHNGIIENHLSLRRRLQAGGHVFETETDTETVVHLLTDHLNRGLAPEAAMLATLAEVEGAFALVALFRGTHDLMIGARRGNPLVVGHGEGENFLGSDALAVGPLTRRITFLEEGDIAVVRPDHVRVLRPDGTEVRRQEQIVELSGALIGKGNHRHFMEKEIHEQPAVVGEAINALVSAVERRVALPPLPLDLATVQRLSIIACGTSFYAGLVARYWFEDLARLPVDLDVASEFRYRDPVLAPDTLYVFVSQSGETIDTLSALRHVKAQGGKTLALTNVATSAMAREADGFLPLRAGIEIGVASTKCFLAQLTLLAALALAAARARGRIDREREAALTQALAEVPSRVAEVIHRLDASLEFRAVVETVAAARDVLYLGRGTSYPIAMEGALKLKELSYIHAEGYPAGEMKHGPIALIEEAMPVIVVAPHGPWFEKTAANVQEVAARRGYAIVLTDSAGRAGLGDVARAVIELPTVDPFVAPLLYTVPVQLLAYHVAVRKGTDVDQPRNLAKSVVVE